jgi:hypothetical protein
MPDVKTARDIEARYSESVSSEGFFDDDQFMATPDVGMGYEDYVPRSAALCRAQPERIDLDTIGAPDAPSTCCQLFFTSFVL